MGFESIPLLTAIWTAIGAVVKVVWDSIAKAAARSAFYFATIIPMILKWFLKYRAFALALVLSVAVLIRTLLRTIFGVVNTTFAVQGSMAFLEAHFTWMYYMCVHGPLALDTAYSLILGQIVPLWLSLLSLHWLRRKFDFVFWVLSKKFKGAS